MTAGAHRAVDGEPAADGDDGHDRQLRQAGGAEPRQRATEPGASHTRGDTRPAGRADHAGRCGATRERASRGSPPAALGASPAAARTPCLNPTDGTTGSASANICRCRRTCSLKSEQPSQERR